MRQLKHVLWLTLREKRDVSLAVFFGFIAGLAGVALLASSGYLISKAALTSQITVLIVLGAGLKLFGLASALSRYAERLFSHRATFTMLSDLRSSFFEKLAPLAPGIFVRFRSGDLLARIVGDVESLQNFLLRVLYPPIVLGLVFLSTIFFSMYFSVWIALAIATGMLLTIFAVPAIFAWRQRKFGSQKRKSRAALSTEATEFIYGFRDLKIHQELEAKERELKAFAEAYEEQQRKEGLEENLSQSANALVALLASLAVLGIGAYFTAAGELDGLYLAMLVMISIGAFENVAPMAVFSAHFEENRKAAVRLDEVVAEARPETGSLGLLPGEIGIEVDGASFTYPSEERAALKDLRLAIKPGTKNAVVGPSGSGKSTLLQLLLNVLPADGGTVRFNGHALGELDPENLWDRMNVVLQENHFFFGTVKSNLQIANEAASDRELKEALDRAMLDGLALEQVVQEKGQNLSGGQKQRLAIARALLKGQSLWLMDEPLSSVDGATAKTIYAALFEEHKTDTFVVISHDLSGLEGMDQIIVMEDGRIVESGTYKELMDRKGYFYEMKEIEKSVFA
ncbi:thiol reductant ABC exporter subunit CydC [Planococcus sp. FY231025]|uniref:thiol reductant ABC exporter subunit CydC n=1 Tax=Planococcus sp. FY231025 TaxID=3455699 RepID=UPI003F930AD8